MAADKDRDILIIIISSTCLSRGAASSPKMATLAVHCLEIYNYPPDQSLGLCLSDLLVPSSTCMPDIQSKEEQEEDE